MTSVGPTENSAPSAQPVSKGMALVRVLRGKDFSLLWAGQGLSLLGDQFFMVAVPWLVLQMTGNALALGAVLALSGIPRALLMLVGGAITDRFSPRVIMLSADIARLLLTGTMAVLALTGHVEIWMLYVGALCFGVVAGFFNPASTAIMPRLVDKGDLAAANSLFQGVSQLTVLLGPALAGAVIAFFARTPQGAASFQGVGVALAFDAVSFLVSVITLQLMSLREDGHKAADGSVIQAIKEGMAFVWRDRMLRLMFLIVAAINCFFAAPLMVGVPVLANTRLSEGAAAFGLIMSAFGGGSLLGYLSAGALPKPKHMGYVVIGIVAAFGLALISFGYIHAMLSAALLLFLLGAANGYISIVAVTWLQCRTPGPLMGRVMSLVLFANVALSPLSQALSGALIGIDMTGLFIGYGIAMMLVALGVSTVRDVRQLQM